MSGHATSAPRSRARAARASRDAQRVRLAGRAVALLAALPALACSIGGGAPAARPAVALAAGTARIDPRGVEQVWVPAGAFRMGTDAETARELGAQPLAAWMARALASEQPQHEVRIGAGYWIDRHEVTNAAFAAFVAAGGYGDAALWSAAGRAWLARQDAARLPAPCAGDGPRLPRACVTWFEAEAYAAWRGGRLPTEAEWELAARGPSSLLYPWGNEFDAARCNVVGSSAAADVGSHPGGASWVGAHDLAGNVMEWVQDWLDPAYYRGSPLVDPTGPPAGAVKVEKGGWWGGPAFAARSAYRHFEDPPDYRDAHIGFRVVSPAAPPGLAAEAWGARRHAGDRAARRRSL